MLKPTVMRKPTHGLHIALLRFLVAALSLPLQSLAEMTSMVLLVVFLFVNVALIVIKRKAPEAPFRVPGFVPWFGLVATFAALVAASGVLA